MTEDTRKRKEFCKNFQETIGAEKAKELLLDVIENGKSALDKFILNLGKEFLEAVLNMERREVSGQDYYPTNPKLQKWASQGGSVYLGDQKKMKNKDGYSKELLSKILRGTSERKYEETVIHASVSRHVVQMTAKQLEELKESDLSDFNPFAVFY
jgi:hypothetical protein